jgi:alpha,alpha-trehalase
MHGRMVEVVTAGKRGALRAGFWSLGAGIAVLVALVGPAAGGQQALPPRSSRPATAGHAVEAPVPIDGYIQNAWSTLTRSMLDCATLKDPKVTTEPVLYLPQDFAEPAEVAALGKKCGVRVERLPVRIERLGQSVELGGPGLSGQGLLYLPHAYVVPGGRFNEMYGWDSYFIVLGLLTTPASGLAGDPGKSGRVELARGMVENFFFEIEHYGGLLNANRTYYLTRSQPPFLSSEIRAVWSAEIASGRTQEAQAWLEEGYGYAVRDHALWMSEAHRAGDTGLARYFDFGEGPVAEMEDNNTYYQDVIRWLLAHPGVNTAGVHTDYLVEGPMTVGPEMSAGDREKLAAESCDPEASAVCARAHVGRHWLTKDFYKGDRAMRESGFDTTFRFGAFSGSTHHFAPVCLNSLLYKYERDLAWMAEKLGKADEAKQWDDAAAARRAAMDKYLWNAEKGMYFDYDFVAEKQSGYEYLTVFYPLWAGAASAEQARKVEGHIGVFEKQGGLAMSTLASGVQWDLPYGWAPVTWLAVDGMKEEGDLQDAVRLSSKFMETVRDNFACDHSIREKFNVVTGSSEAQVAVGYRQNVVGFGWTNGVYLKMEKLVERAGIPEATGAETHPVCTAAE